MLDRVYNLLSKENIQILVYKDLMEASIALYEYFLQHFDSSIAQTFIVSGGSTPQLFFKNLASISNWGKAQILLADDRMVEETSEQSNIRFVHEHFFNHMKSDFKPNLIKLVNNKNLADTLKIIKPTIAFLGMGSDGHTASLFPQKKENFLLDKDFIIIKNEFDDFHRISLSYSYLMRSESINFLISGSNKATTLKRVLSSDYQPETYPIQYLLKNYRGNINFFVDETAARLVI